MHLPGSINLRSETAIVCLNDRLAYSPRQLEVRSAMGARLAKVGSKRIVIPVAIAACLLDKYKDEITNNLIANIPKMK
jgi:hypothetical protein